MKHQWLRDKRNKKLTGGIPDRTITADEWLLTGWYVLDNPTFGPPTSGSISKNDASPPPRVGRLKLEKI